MSLEKESVEFFANPTRKKDGRITFEIPRGLRPMIGPRKGEDLWKVIVVRTETT